MDWTIRPVADADYPALAEVASAAFPGVPHSAEEIHEEDQQVKPPARFARLVAEVNGRVVGSASYFQHLSRLHPQKFWSDAYVHPAFQGHGIGGALDEALMAIMAEHGPISTRTFTREDLPHSLSFYERRGYREAKRTWESHLDLEAFDPKPYGEVAPAGITIRPLSELMHLPDWKERTLALYNQIQEDVPDIDPAVTLTLEHFEQNHLQSQRFLSDGYLIALDGDRFVGTSGLWRTAEADLLSVGLTGVLREYRGRQIALALKLRGIEYARALGIRRIKTYNASNNAPMLAINVKMGFVRQPAWIHLIKEF